MPSVGDLLYSYQLSPQKRAELLTAPANPNDPQQQMKWSIEKQNALANQGLFNPEDFKKIMQMLGPLFQQQMTGLNNAKNRGLSEASRYGSSYAASRGYDNPYALVQRARSGVENAYAPQYNQLIQSQLQTGLGANVQNQQFKYGNASNMTNLWSQLMMMNEQMKNQPSFWENLFSGLVGAGGQIGAAALMAPKAPVAP